MIYFPSRRLVNGAGALLAATCGAMFAPAYLPLVLAGYAGLAIAGLADWYWLRRHGNGVNAAVSVPSSITLGERIAAAVRVSNGTPRRLPVTLRPVLPSQGAPQLEVHTTRIEAGGEVSIQFQIQSQVRGEHRFGDVYLRFPAPLGLIEGQRRAPNDRLCKVYPDIDAIKEYIVTRRMRQLAAPHLRTARLRGIGSEFESLRDYDEGDDVRRVDWKATARLNRLIVRNYEIEHFRNVVIVVDRGRLMCGKMDGGTKFDAALNATLMLTAVALDSGDRSGLLVFDEDVACFLPPRAGMAQLHNVIETIYDVQPNLSESHFRRAFIYLQTRLTKRSLIVVLSDVMDIDASASLIHGVLALARRHLVVFAALRTPEIEGVIEHPGDSEEAPFRKAVAVRLMSERTEVMARINKGGAHVLDLRPEELTLPVVNKYIELREQNLL